MKGLFRRFRSLPLRSRLALLVAAAVAFAVAAVSVTCWFIVQGKLYDELNNELQSSANRPQGGKLVSTISNCNGSEVDPSGQSPTDAGGFRAQFESYLQVVTADGESCVASVSPGKIEVAGSDTDFAKNPVAGHGTFRDGTDTKGNPVRVLTVPLMISNPDGTTTIIKDAATMYAVPLKGTNATLNELALVLLLVGGIGVLGAGAAGLWVARAGLRPVDKLTETVEHVARTEDLTVRIPVEGNDEIARLSESFNSMTASLASSRELQQQLIADAGHELRTPLTSLRTNIELLTRSEETGRPIPRRTARRCSPP